MLECCCGCAGCSCSTTQRLARTLYFGRLVSDGCSRFARIASVASGPAMCTEYIDCENLKVRSSPTQALLLIVFAGFFVVDILVFPTSRKWGWDGRNVNEWWSRPGTATERKKVIIGVIRVSATGKGKPVQRKARSKQTLTWQVVGRYGQHC